MVFYIKYSKSMNVQKELAKLGINPKVSKDQFFLTDVRVAKKLVSIAQINKKDRVLEVGAGLGILTRELSKKAKRVISIEIDEQFKPILDKFSNNIELVYGDAYKLLNSNSFRAKTKPPTKTVSCIPYSRAQNMLHNYTNSYWYQGDVVWLAPASLASKVNNEPILSAYFEAEIVEMVPKTVFFPQPNTSSAIIYFRRITNPVKTKNFEIYFRRWLYNHENWKVKNALIEGIINVAYDIKNVRVTKNQARKLFCELGISNEELEKLTNNIRLEYYFEIPKKLKKWFISLA